MSQVIGPTKQLFAYFGGKQQVADRLVPMIPPHDVYVEPFAGGLAVFFRKVNAKLNIVNDYNSLIANLYSVLAADPSMFQEFVHRVKWLVQSKDIYKLYEAWYKDFMKNEKNKEQWFKIPNIQAAVIYYYYIQNSFNQQVNTGLSDKTSNWNTALKDRLWEMRKKFDKVIVENVDFAKLIDKYNKRENVFWFFDPPYVITGKVPYYQFNFGEEQHQLLHDKCNEIHEAGGKVMITYDDFPIIRRLYTEEHWNIVDFPMTYSSNAKKVNELVIINYKINVQEGLGF